MNGKLTSGEGEPRPIESPTEQSMQNINRRFRHKTVIHDDPGDWGKRVMDVYNEMLKRANSTEKLQKKYEDEKKLEFIKDQPQAILTILEGYLFRQQSAEQAFKEMTKLKKSSASGGEISAAKEIWRAEKKVLENQFNVNKITEEMLGGEQLGDSVTDDNRMAVKIIRDLRLGALNEEERLGLMNEINKKTDLSPEAMKIFLIYHNNKERQKKFPNYDVRKHKFEEILKVKGSLINDYLSLHSITDNQHIVKSGEPAYKYAEETLDSRAGLVKIIQSKRLAA